MKTLIGVMILIIIIIGGWLFLYDSIEKSALEFEDSLNQIVEEIEREDWEIAYIRFLEVKKDWSQKRNILTILIAHHEIDNIDLSMAKTDKYLVAKDKPLSLGEIEVLKTLFIIVKENEALTLPNIL